MVVMRPLLVAAEVLVGGKKFTVVKVEFVFLAPSAQWYMRVRKAKLKVFKKLLSNVFST